ncbi:hypothetical protein PR003_g23354 [Phytophthora rubi]|uniref:Uncharacterized protein n=1 Tax=Phytophthora rubi TaxID=129364 RepID=A0A6A4D7P6_9STRA|nr:hypothetical protein PR003_g23354 [Phytophthora rubi]
MESLCRLTSSVFDAGPARLVRRASMGTPINFFRH